MSIATVDDRTDPEQTTHSTLTCVAPSCFSRRGVERVEGADGALVTLCRYHRKHFLGVSS